MARAQASGIRGYLVVTAGYWAFTITDGAIRMLVVLYFHLLGYSPFDVALLFLFYEFFGIVTNLVGGWLGARFGLNQTMLGGMLLQVAALALLTVPENFLSVAWVMFAQALSGIAKDLNKMSAKASVKALVPDEEGGNGTVLFRWVSALTGSKNALKGAGFFIGAALLEAWGFAGAVAALAVGLAMVFVAVAWALPRGLGRMASKARFAQVFSRSPPINWLAAARLLLFASRDVWFVVGLPVFLYESLGWSFMQVGSFLALWIVGYGAVQAAAPRLCGRGPAHATLLRWSALLTLVPGAIALTLPQASSPAAVLIIGLALFGIVFALNSALHSFLVLAYSNHDRVAMNVGFYYMANAAGRLLGTVLSGALYQVGGLSACLWCATAFTVLATLLSLRLPAPSAPREHTGAAPV